MSGIAVPSVDPHALDVGGGIPGNSGGGWRFGGNGQQQPQHQQRQVCSARQQQPQKQ